jgi:hypothetical protein
MEPPAPELEPELAEQLSELGEDLLLLSVRPRDGGIVAISRINYGLMGSELIRLARPTPAATPGITSRLSPARPGGPGRRR